MINMLPEYNQVDKMIFIDDDKMSAHFIMQTALMRHTIYRATYNLLIRILFIVLEKIKKETVTEMLYYLLQSHIVILTKPKELSF